MSERVAGIWECADCGWRWPLLRDPGESAECDACGGEMERVGEYRRGEGDW